MGFTLQSNALMAGVPTNAMTVNAYRASRFALPNTDDPVPDGLPADAGPVSSGNSALNGDGYFALPVPDSDPYYVTAVGSDGHTYWLSAIPPVADTVQQAYGGVDQHAFRTLAASTIDASMNGLSLPQSSIKAASSLGSFLTGPNYGQIVIFVGGGYQLVTYGGFSGGNTFTGCSGGTGTLVAGSGVYQAYVNGKRRRLVFMSSRYSVSASGDQAVTQFEAVCGGRLTNEAQIGIHTWSLASSYALDASTVGVVDPNGMYFVIPTNLGAGTSSNSTWVEVDL